MLLLIVCSVFCADPMDIKGQEFMFTSGMTENGGKADICRMDMALHYKL